MASDLSITSVTDILSSEKLNDSLDGIWTVEDLGLEALLNSWREAIYLSESEALDKDEKFSSLYSDNRSLTSEEPYFSNGILTIPNSAVASGNYGRKLKSQFRKLWPLSH